MRIILIAASILMPFSLQAESLPPLLSEPLNESPHRLFLTSEHSANISNQQRIKINGGYSYNLLTDINIIVGAQIGQTGDTHTDISGFLSGVSYQLTDRVSLQSTLHSSYNSESKANSGPVSAELSSRLQLSEDLDLHATLDYREWQQGVEVGVGFRF